MKILFAALALSAFTTTFAASTPFEGTWAMTARGHTLIVLTIKTSSAGVYAGTLMRPTRTQISPQLGFSNVLGPAITTELQEVRTDGERLKFGARSPSNPQQIDRYEMTVDTDLAYLSLAAMPAAPFVLLRTASAQVANEWDADATYLMDDPTRSNEGLRHLFDEDQRARAEGSNIDWKIVAENDARRRSRVRELLGQGRVRTAKDFHHAAMIFQHGNSGDDYLLAHTLAVIAAAKGNTDAIWLTAATLDRYLQSAGQPQIFGTQFSRNSGAEWTQDPFNPSLISDALRRQLGVPSLDEQKERLKQLEESTQRK